MRESEAVCSSEHKSVAEVRGEDLTPDNIRAFFRCVALTILEDEKRAPELVAKYISAY